MRRSYDDMQTGLYVLSGLCEKLIEELYSAWREGATDCHTTGDDEHWEASQANKYGEQASAEVAGLRRELGL